MTLEVLCWNVRAPAEERAWRQAGWLRHQAADVVVLTECRATRGSRLLAQSLRDSGRTVQFVVPEGREYAVIMACRGPVQPTPLASGLGYLRPRAASARIGSGPEVIGLYVPSRGFDRGERALRKRRFLETVDAALAAGSARGRIVCGDLNVLEPGHVPRYRHVEDWESGFYSGLRRHDLVDAYRWLHPDDVEHSWHGRSGDGYRYDHCFVSRDLLPSLRSCSYVHEPREQRLSDHSAMSLELA
jgi:exodeoxyribonuclease-3